VGNRDPIPFKTLRYPTGSNRTWGFNVKRNIAGRTSRCTCHRDSRFDVYRVSSAAKLTGLNLPPRRDLKLTPYVLGSVDKDYTVVSDQVVRKGNRSRTGNVGVDVKMGRASEPHRGLHG